MTLSNKEEVSFLMKEYRKFCQREYRKAVKNGQVTRNGVAYFYFLAGMDGASFTLFRTPSVTDEDIAKAKQWLYRDHDVVGNIKVEKVKS